MIVWIASYPRSGNSLTRSILYQTMGLKSFSCYEAENERSRDHYELLGPFGKTYYDLPYQEFLKQASDSHELFLVKTHELPSDDNPALYVVRDGRSAIASFLRFERKNWPTHPTSMLQLIVGNHAFGGWSKHYRAWTERPFARTLVLKFPELVNISPQQLSKVAAFLGYQGPIEDWSNPLEEMKQIPFFEGKVGEGSPTWTAVGDWDENCDLVFWEQHGELMQELGFNDRPLQVCLPDIKT